MQIQGLDILEQCQEFETENDRSGRDICGCRTTDDCTILGINYNCGHIDNDCYVYE